MIHKDCCYYDGDEDCNKCSQYGYISTCVECDWYDHQGEVKCFVCKQFFKKERREDGLPNGVKMELEDGRSIPVCTDCILYHPEKYVKAIEELSDD